MPHQRQLIREAAKTTLVGKTAAGPRVYETRIVPWRKLELPALAIYTLDESVDPASSTTAPRELERTVDLAIEGAVRQGENIDDSIDELALEIERAMHADPYLGGTASDSILSSTEIEVVEESDRLVGVVRLVYSTRYYTLAPDPADVELDDFKTADIRTSLGGVVEAENQAHDVVELKEVQ